MMELIVFASILIFWPFAGLIGYGLCRLYVFVSGYCPPGHPLKGGLPTYIKLGAVVLLEMVIFLAMFLAITIYPGLVRDARKDEHDAVGMYILGEDHPPGNHGRGKSIISDKTENKND